MTEVKYIRPELIEAIARNTLKNYDASLILGYEAKSVPIEDIIESMGLSLEFQYIRKNGRILGETVFDDDYVPIYNMDEKRYELIFVERGTIILDASLLRCRTQGRLRFTAAHELAHWLIHQELYSGTGDTAAMAKSISKSSDADKYDLNVVVYFEEQGIYSNQPGAEFYITIYGSIAQSESENISANVKWGKARSAKEGNVPFHYKNFLGYRKGADGKPEIDPDEAETVRFIYERFLAGDSLSGIAQKLNDLQVPTPSGKGLWQNSTIQSILSNEKYKGDAIINKTYIKDCLSKKVMVNNGERPKYYVENNHPAIIDAVTFGRVQEELARRSGKPKTKQVGTKTEQGKYSSKYAMTELLVCGECKTPYRRCTWTVKGQKKIVWRCINRLDFGKKYCHNSPTVEESILQRAVMRAIMETAQQNLGVLQTLKVHIGMGLQSEQTEDNSMELQIRIAEIDAEFKAMLAKISTDTVDAFDEEKAKRLMDEKARLQQQLGNIRDGQLKREQTQSRLDDIYTILDGLKNRPMEYDEQIVRQLLECITVDSKEQITVIFVGGLKVVQPLID